MLSRRSIMLTSLVGCLAATVGHSANAGDQQTASDWVTNFLGRAIAIMADKQIPDVERFERFRRLIAAAVDIPADWQVRAWSLLAVGCARTVAVLSSPIRDDSGDDLDWPLQRLTGRHFILGPTCHARRCPGHDSRNPDQPRASGTRNGELAAAPDRRWLPRYRSFGRGNFYGYSLSRRIHFSDSPEWR